MREVRSYARARRTPPSPKCSAHLARNELNITDHILFFSWCYTQQKKQHLPLGIHRWLTSIHGIFCDWMTDIWEPRELLWPTGSSRYPIQKQETSAGKGTAHKERGAQEGLHIRFKQFSITVMYRSHEFTVAFCLALGSQNILFNEVTK